MIKLDEHYTTALVAGDNKNYLWLLSKNACISEQVKMDYVKEAESKGFDTQRLIFDIQKDKHCP